MNDNKQLLSAFGLKGVGAAAVLFIIGFTL